jgi:hypothetical protein
VNKTEYTHLSTTESHFEEYRRTRGRHVGESSSTYQGWGLQGLFVMGIFLACGFLLTFRWGGITTILVSEARTRPSRPSQGTGEPTSSQEEAEGAKDASTSMSDHSCPV